MDRFKIEQVDPERFIKVNELQAVTNPVTFNGGNVASSDGLLSNQIFGISIDERSGIFAYIDLIEYFIEPYYYKAWCKIDRNLKSCVYETDTFSIDKDGYLVKDENGNNGLKWLKNNIDKINFKNTKRELLLGVLMDGKKRGDIFTKKFIITPPYYRDVDTSSDGRVGLGEVNKIYVQILNTVRSLKTSNDYGLEMAGGIRGRIQDLLLEVYNWHTVGESVIGGEHTGAGIFKKFGIMRRSVMAKTTDNAARMVISSPTTKNCDSIDDLMTDMDYVAVPLSAVLVNAYPFIIYHLRQFFNNEFGGKIYYPYIDSKGTEQKIELDDPLVAFSDDVLDKEIAEFVHGYSNRLKPILVPNKENKRITLKLKGYQTSVDMFNSGKYQTSTLLTRDMTWMDVFYIAATEAVQDKMAIITRYPIDSYFNQFSAKIHISSTKETEVMVIDDKLYRWYPSVKQEEVGSDTSNKFIDTFCMSNPYCGLMNADFDGDTVTCKIAYSVEANEELRKKLDSPSQYITLGGVNGRTADKEAIQAIYNLTLTFDEDKLTDPKM